MGTPPIFSLKNLRNLKKPRERDADDSSPISRLPDEIILEILNKLIDLKTLCSCYLVSRRFSSIVRQVDAISLTVPPINPHALNKNTVGEFHAVRPVFRSVSLLYGESFIPAYRFLRKFKRVKSVCIEFPSSSHRGIDDRCLFKWKVKFGTKFESFIHLSPKSILDKDEFYLNANGDEEESDQEENEYWLDDMYCEKSDIVHECMKDVMAWRVLLLDLVENLPLLEKVSLTDSERRGRLSLSGKKLSEVKDWLHSSLKIVVDRVELPQIGSKCYGYSVVLKLPVSGYVMKGVYYCVMEMKNLQGGYDDLKNIDNDGFEDKEEAAYSEAVMEIWKEHVV